MAHWQEDAACRDVSLDLFFSYDTDDIHVALGYCEVCPVVEECLMDDLETTNSIYGLHGVRGGMTEHDRRAYARRIRKEAG